MRLGELIRQLESCNPDGYVTYDLGNVAPTHFASWRGRYEELALGYDLTAIKVGELLGECRDVVGKTLEGYKGGEFRMTGYTPVNIDNVGEYTNTKLLAVVYDGSDAILMTTRVIE